MLTIRKEQIRALGLAQTTNFERWMVSHLRKFFPEYSVTGDVELQAFVRRGIQRARSYEITARRDVCKFIDLMAALGSDFDHDDRIPWAGEILRDARAGEARIPRLIKTAKAHLAQQLSQPKATMAGVN